MILGAGIFTGLSNLLCGAAAKEGARSLDLAIRSSPYSGAGTGTIELMVASLAQATRAFVDGVAKLGPSVAKGPRFRFPSGEAPSLQVSLAEPWMVHHSTQVPNVRAFLAPKPALLVYAFLAMPLWLVRARLFRGFFGWYMAFLRRLVLRSVASRVELLAVTDRQELSLVADDGMQTAGDAIAAMVVQLGGRTISGLKMVDEVLELDPVLATMRELGASEVRVARR